MLSTQLLGTMNSCRVQYLVAKGAAGGRPSLLPLLGTAPRAAVSQLRSVWDPYLRTARLLSITLLCWIQIMHAMFSISKSPYIYRVFWMPLAAQQLCSCPSPAADRKMPHVHNHLRLQLWCLVQTGLLHHRAVVLTWLLRLDAIPSGLCLLPPLQYNASLPSIAVAALRKPTEDKLCRVAALTY